MNRKRITFKFCAALWLTGCVWLGGGFVNSHAATPPVTSAEGEAFGRQLEAHIAQQDFMFYVKAMDFDGLVDNILPAEAKTVMGDDSLPMLENGLRYGMETQVKGFKSLKFLRMTTMDGIPCAVMRVLATNGMVNYQNLELKHGAEGRVVVDDIYLYLNGEKLSDTTRRAIIPMLQEKNKSSLDRLFGSTPDIVKYSSQWIQMSGLLQHGKYQEILDIYNQLPADLRQEKFILVLRLRATQNLDHADYLATLRLWRQAYPDDPSIDIISIDYFILIKEYQQALDCIDRLDKSVGGDPYQDFERAAVYSLMKDYPNAEKFARQAFEREPDLAKSGFFAISLMKNQFDYAGCIEMLDQMHTMGGYSKTALDRGLRSSPGYAPLLQSDAYHKWYPTGSGQDVPTMTPMTIPARPG